MPIQAIRREAKSFKLFLGLAAILACSAPSALAQVDLTFTEAESGNFTVGAGVCSPFSPQFSNSTTFAGPGTCVSTITIWVVNKGANTAGAAGNPIVVTDALSPVQPKGSTILSANGYCAFPGGCGNLGGAPAPPANGWNCTVSQGFISCNRSDVLVAGQVDPPIVIRVLREDFAPLSCGFNDLIGVSGGTGGPNALTEINPADNSGYGPSLPFPPNFLLPFLDTGRFVTIHSVPEGLSVKVDGSLVKTPHTDFWLVGSFHSIDADENGLPFPGNPPWVFTNFNIGGITGSVANSTLLTTFPPNVITGATFYEQITAIYHKP